MTTEQRGDKTIKDFFVPINEPKERMMMKFRSESPTSETPCRLCGEPYGEHVGAMCPFTLRH